MPAIIEIKNENVSSKLGMGFLVIFDSFNSSKIVLDFCAKKLQIQFLILYLQLLALLYFIALFLILSFLF